LVEGEGYKDGAVVDEEGSVSGSSERREMERNRERRWSVTDDGVVSD
jgi:hypothetical protein